MNAKMIAEEITIPWILENDLLQVFLLVESSKNLLENLRTWLKDGSRFNYSASSILVAALVYLETDDRIREFCYDGQVIDM